MSPKVACEQSNISSNEKNVYVSLEHPDAENAAPPKPCLSEVTSVGSAVLRQGLASREVRSEKKHLLRSSPAVGRFR